ncbi:MAG: hypothetical protein DBX57_02790 [Clostridia bacterium]|nr:MAG: hypothetical protein DBX57_02790 [Clostridia bacterium]
MKKRMVSLLLVLVMLLGLLPTAALAAPVGGGSGTAEDPYLIATAQELVDFRDAVNDSAKKSTSKLCAKLTANIDLGNEAWTPIGKMTNTYSDYVAFGGVFDGDGHTISGLKIDNSAQYQALFGYVKGGTIKNLTVEGSVTTATTSSAYAAGIVAYGNPVTMETCMNRVTVTVTQKGYAAGVAAYANTGSTITGCTNQGNISGVGGYLGGIVGTASGVTITNCINNGDVVDSRRSDTYPYGVGGIAGSAISASRITNCGNAGAVTSHLKNTGGVVGYFAGTAEKCFNSGNVTGIYATGGIVGNISSANTSVTDCYNTGSILCNAPTAQYKDSNAKGVGGIVGNPGSTSNKGNVVTNCYNAGTITNADAATTDITVGGVIGSSSANNYKGEATKNLISAENCYYLAADGLNGDGANAEAAGVTSKTAEELKASGMAALLGGSYIDQAGGYPMLGWQDPNAEYTVTFTLSPSTAALTVWQGETTYWPDETGAFHLKNGTYSYKVEAEERQTEEGTFTVAYGGQSIAVTLKETLYDVVFTTAPADAVLSVTNKDNAAQTPLADGRTYRLPKSGNPYSYSARAFGYADANGTYTVTGKNDAPKVTLDALARQTVTFGAVTAADGKEIMPLITVTSKDWPSQTLTAEPTGGYLLPNGEYSYTISCSGYKSVRGDFKVEGAAVAIPAVTLAVQTAWDGETLTEPQKDADGKTYLIGSPDELMWFNQNAKMTDSARLTADICINEDVKADTASLYKWTPISNYDKRYTGSFDGAGHTVSGLYIATTSGTKCTAMFGYAGTGSMISNLTLADSIINGTANYTGGIAGDAYDMQNCHVLKSVTVTGTQYVGGVAGYVDHSISKCSNAATVTASSSYVGGVTGYMFGETMLKCYNTGSVTGASSVGGLTGSIYNNGTVDSCYNTGAVTATSTKGIAGGLLGSFRYGTLRNSYTATAPTAQNAGSVAGRLENAFSRTVENVYVLDHGLDIVGVSATIPSTWKVTALSDAALKALTAEELGDNFKHDTKNQNGGYPILKWQDPAAAESEDPDRPESDPNGWDGKETSIPTQTDGVYQIRTAAELKWFADAVKTDNAIKGVLMQNIDLNHRDWTPVDANFAGELDGAGHSITNLYCKNETGAAALFAANGGTIQNLTVSGKIIGSNESAILTSVNTGTIKSCTTEGTLRGGGYTAGIAARNSGTISSSLNRAAVSGTERVAGVTAENSGTVRGSANGGLIRASDMMAAGAAAANETNGTVENCANNGAVVSSSAIMRSYVGGVVGWNKGAVNGAYNAGNVETLGGCAGGTVGLNVSKNAVRLYNCGDVTGGDFEDDGYPTDNAVSSAEALEKARRELAAVLTLLGEKETISGELSVDGKLEARASVKGVYTGTETELIYVWYYSYGEGDDVVVAIADEFTIPETLSGRVLKVKALSAATTGVLKAEGGKIAGLEGTVRISGAAVVGRTLTATFYSSSEQGTLHYQWYRGNAAIDGATGTSYPVTADDVGKRLTVKVTSASAPGTLSATTQTVTTAADAGLWELADCTEPANVGGVYQITKETELHWFASEVNSGNTAISARLLNDLALTSGNWYPIGKTGHAYTGTFDGDGHKITNLKVELAQDEVGFFGLIGAGGKVQKLHVQGMVKATGTANQTGGIAGVMSDTEGVASITDCTFEGTVSGGSQVGGIVGSVGLNNKVERCGSDATVSGSERVGGIAGACSYGNIYYCRNRGKVGAENAKHVGGIVGDMQNYAVVCGSYNTGSVTGADYLGGIAGEVYVASAPLGCYNTGDVGMAMHCGGALGSFGGDQYITVVKGSFYKGPLSEAYKANGAALRTEAQMKLTGFVTELNREAAVTCYEKDAALRNDGYPVLTWESEGFLITLDANGGTCKQEDCYTDREGRIGQLPEPYRWNYRFDGWFTEETGGDAVTAQTVFTENTTLYAHWTIIRPSTGSQGTKNVYFSLSKDGVYVTGNDSEHTLLASVPVEVSWFDLEPYGLGAYTVKRGGRVVKQPTMLHLMIRMLETYYLEAGQTLTNNTDALTASGSFGSLYFQKFWGGGENLTYFLNHAFPVMYPGMGATADYMTLENGDLVELGMFTSGEFYTDEKAGYPYFVRQDGTAADRLTLAAREAQTLVLHLAGSDMYTAAPKDQILRNTKVYVAQQPKTGDAAQWTLLGTTDKDGALRVSFRQAGTYYVAAAGSSVSAPGVCLVTVTADEVSRVEQVIAALPDAKDVTTDDEVAIRAARAAYDALEAAERAQVENAARLTAAEAMLAALLNPAPATPSAPAADPVNPDAGKEQIRFDDVSDNAWYASAVRYAVENGLMNGTGTGKFSPAASTTRGMVMTILARMAGADTSGTPWYAAGMNWAKANGVSDGTNPPASVTREQLVTMLFRYAAAHGMEAVTLEKNLSRFTDKASVSAWAVPAMNWAVGQGLIEGSNGLLRPQANASRAEVAAILMRFAQKIAK